MKKKIKYIGIVLVILFCCMALHPAGRLAHADVADVVCHIARAQVGRFHLDGNGRVRLGYLTREILGELLELIRKAGKEKQKSARISLNWPQAVLCFDYVEDQGQPEAEVTLEEANEGEQE